MESSRVVGGTKAGAPHFYHLSKQERMCGNVTTEFNEERQIELTKAYSSASFYRYRKQTIQEMGKNTTWNVLGMHA